MHPETPPEDTDRKLQRRFALLFERFAAAGSAVRSTEAAFLLDQLRAPLGARVLCCDRSLTEYGWALTAAGCSVQLLSARTDEAPSDGAICSAELLTSGASEPPLRSIALLGARLGTGARLVVTGLFDPETTSKLFLESGFRLLVTSTSPEGLSLMVWVREGS